MACDAESGRTRRIIAVALHLSDIVLPAAKIVLDETTIRCRW